jgi:purine-binding chemotaxis protein CheW
MNANTVEYLGCRIGTATIAIAVSYVQEVFGTSAITRVPNCAEFIVGMVNVRGTIVPVLALDGVPAVRSSMKIVVLNSTEGMVGLFVTSIEDLIQFDRLDPAPPPPTELAVWKSCFSHCSTRDTTYFILNVNDLIAGTVARISEVTPTP